MPDYQKAIDSQLVRLELAYGFQDNSGRFITANCHGLVCKIEGEFPIRLNAMSVLEALSNLPRGVSYDAAWAAIMGA
jgi:hypothetical protein